jgi:outer membrane lipoprotein-sorting protein
MARRSWVGAGLGAALVGAVGVGLLVAPVGASAAPPLPPVSPEDLISSVMTANPGPLNGTVAVDNGLGLPALPQLPQLANGTSSVRVWSGGDGRGRVALPSSDGERTLVSDGTTRWSYDSADRTATRAPADGPEGQVPGGPAGPPGRPGAPDPAADPTTAATRAIATLRQSSTVSVVGTEEVAGRPAYTLVLTPLPTERTLLREVRVAVDAEKRLPLQLTVLAQGQGEPALQVGFSDITFGPQDARLFTFTPPPGTTVRDAPTRDAARPDGAEPTRVGEGWDTVVVGRAPAGAQQPGAQQPGTQRPGTQQPGRPEGAPDLSALGTPVSGPWGAGRQITTAVATVIVTDDGRIAAGAVPPQVLTEALAR